MFIYWLYSGICTYSGTILVQNDRLQICIRDFSIISLTNFIDLGAISIKRHWLHTCILTVATEINPGSVMQEQMQQHLWEVNQTKMNLCPLAITKWAPHSHISTYNIRKSWEEKKRASDVYIQLIIYSGIATGDTIYWHGLALIPASISNYICHKVLGEITFLFPNLNGEAVGIWKYVGIYFHPTLYDRSY